MALHPIPFSALVERLVHELHALVRDGEGSVFELPARKIWRGPPAGLDLTALHHGRPASNPLGPAAGPHTQLAQNIVASWLAGARIIELKTVQVRDDLVIPRPCIDMATVGYNVEWSQELRLDESAREYVKAAMLIAIARHELPAAFAIDPSACATIFDLSAGYDLAGIQSDAVVLFLDQMNDAGPFVDELKQQIPEHLAHLRDLPFPRHIGSTLTLSTFHGCPPHEIEAIARNLMEVRHLDVTIKLNPTLLGKSELLSLLHDRLGYRDIEVPDSAFEDDASWDQIHGIVERLQGFAKTLGRSFGIKLTNTLVVRNHRQFFPATERLMYLSGAPLHVFALELGRRFREAFGDTLAISFSSGVDKHNVVDTVACGFVPVTVCSDLLQPGGYGRMHGYLSELAAQMSAQQTSDLPSFIARWSGPDSKPTKAVPALTHNVSLHAAAVASDPRYSAAKNARPPRKIDSSLALFDCLNCNKCIPVCPNAAIFGLEVELRGLLTHQIAILADACNDCGNCDVFCPELGGPNLTKPRFHLTLKGYRSEPGRTGLHLAGPRDAPHFVARLATPKRDLELEGDLRTPSPEGPAAEMVALALAALRPGTWVSSSLATTPPHDTVKAP